VEGGEWGDAAAELGKAVREILDQYAEMLLDDVAGQKARKALAESLVRIRRYEPKDTGGGQETEEWESHDRIAWEPMFLSQFPGKSNSLLAAAPERPYVPELGATGTGEGEGVGAPGDSAGLADSVAEGEASGGGMALSLTGVWLPPEG
jgi:hypothetical protein